MADSIETAGLAGTWIATGLAVIALVGIIGPLYAMKAASSSKNRALNGVWDRSGRYVHGGIPIGNGARIFRRYRVPNLAPNYHKNFAPVAAILPDDDLSEYSFLETIPNALIWNTGWTRLCALIQSHHKSPTGGKAMLRNSTDGRLEIIDAHTALAVSRYWILFLGLLGVYGKETGSSSNQLPQLQYTIYEQDQPDDSSDVSGNTDGPKDNVGLPQYRTYYSRHGISLISGSPMSSISGSTGRFKSLGRQKHSLGLRDIVSFQFEGLGENHLDQSKQQLRTPFFSRLHHRFWLAFGFVPRQETEVISFSFSNPFARLLTEGYLSSVGHKRLRAPYLKLQQSDKVPILLEQCLKALQVRPNGGGSWRIFQWQQAPDFELDRDSWHHVSYNVGPNPNSFPSRGGRSYERSYEQVNLRKGDLVKCLDAMFHLDWDAGGFLIERSSCDLWLELLSRASEDWYEDYWPQGMQSFLAGLQLGQEPHFKAFEGAKSERMRKNQPYFASRVSDLVQFENFLDGFIVQKLKWVKPLVAIAFVLDRDFRYAALQIIKLEASQSGPSEETDSSHDSFRSLHSSGRLRRVSGEETDSSRESSGTIPPRFTAKKSDDRPSNFSYDRSGSVLSWELPGGKRGEATVPDFRNLHWMSTDGFTQIPQRDIVLISAWAANRCMLWECSRDSESLIQFVNGLERNVLVL